MSINSQIKLSIRHAISTLSQEEATTLCEVLQIRTQGKDLALLKAAAGNLVEIKKNWEDLEIVEVLTHLRLDIPEGRCFAQPVKESSKKTKTVLDKEEEGSDSMNCLFFLF